jgi:VWA domain-containing protein/HEAT repeat protein/PBS lyase HEAT-like repeat-containing protein
VSRVAMYSGVLGPSFALLFAGAMGFPAQDASRFPRFDDWFRRYRDSRVLFRVLQGRVPTGCRIDSMAPDGEFKSALRDCVRAADRQAVDRLLGLATFRFHDDPAIETERFGAQLPSVVRDSAIDALSTLKTHDVVGYLSREVLLERSRTPPARRAAAAAALGRAKAPQALLALYAAASDPEPGVRVAAIDAAVSVGGPRGSEVLRWMEDNSVDVRLRVVEAVARSLEGIPPGDAVASPALAAVEKRLVDDDWRVRDAAVEILGEHPTVQAIPALIDALREERNRMAAGSGRKRLQARIGETLARLTGAEVPPLDAGRWQLWWESARSRFRIGGEVAGRPRTRAVAASYFDIPIRSDRLVFTIDVSTSMSDGYGAPPVMTGAGASETIPVPAADPRAWTKLERVKNELVRVIRGLDESALFQIVAFDAELREAFPKLMPATRESKKAAEKFVVSLRTGSGTAIYDALSASLHIPGADTVYLLTDGAPTAGRVIDPEEILRRVTEDNRTMRTEIHTVFVGEDFDTAAPFLTELARRNRGEHRRVPER